MSLRKSAGLLMAFGLMVGLISGGVGAIFTDQVTAEEDISVGTFECQIVEPSDGVIAADGKSVTYDAPTILSSAPGSRPFSFTVENTGDIAAVLSVATTALAEPFSIIGAPIADVPLLAGATHTFSTGVEWTELTAADEGSSGTVTWTVDCNEGPELEEVRSSGLQYGPTGWGGWSCPEGTKVFTAAVEGGDLDSLILWRPGASTDGVTYPSTPFGHTYNETWVPPEEGAIGQNDNDSGETIFIVLQCYVP